MNAASVPGAAAPTGAGKTVIMSALIEAIFYGDDSFPDQTNAIFVWLSDSPELNEQSKQKIELKSDKLRFGQCVTISEESFDMEMLEEIVRTDSKQRYSFNEDRTLIRANQGHSIPVDVELEQKEPPEVLYHGTGEKFVSSIDRQGLIPKSRLYVHLSPDEATARNVGRRHGKPVVYEVMAGQMARDGKAFFLSVNGVWLTKAVPAEYLKKRGQ